MAIGNGVERRPKRAASARMIDGALAMLDEAIGAGDADLFGPRFAALTATCNACHQAEKMAFVVVRPPEIRVSPLGPLPAGAGGK